MNGLGDLNLCDIVRDEHGREVYRPPALDQRWGRGMRWGLAIGVICWLVAAAVLWSALS